MRRCAEDCGLDCDVLDADTARARFPRHRLDDDAVAVLDPDCGVLRPEPAVQAALSAAERAGAHVLPYHPVAATTETRGFHR